MHSVSTFRLPFLLTLALALSFTSALSPGFNAAEAHEKSCDQGWLPLLEEGDEAGGSWQSLHISRSARQPWPGPHTYLRMAGRSVTFMSAWMALSMGCTMKGIAAAAHMSFVSVIYILACMSAQTEFQQSLR